MQHDQTIDSREIMLYVILDGNGVILDNKSMSIFRKKKGYHSASVKNSDGSRRKFHYVAFNKTYVQKLPQD